MVSKINDVYERINSDILSTNPFGVINTRGFRNKIKNMLIDELDDCEIVCDETNNPPDVIDNNCLVAKVLWRKQNQLKYEYVNLVFGVPEQVIFIKNNFI